MIFRICEKTRWNDKNTIRDDVPWFILQERLRERTHRFIFVPFTVTLEAMMKKQVDALQCWNDRSVFRKIVEEQNYFGLSASILQSIFENNANESFYISSALFYRITWGIYWESRLRSESDFRLALSAQLFVDSHLDLIKYILFNRIYDDISLSNKVCTVSSPNLQQRQKIGPFFPSFEKCIFEGDMPDMSSCIDSGNLWRDIRPKINDQFSALVHIFFCKMLNQKCQKRNFPSILYSYVQKYPMILELIRFCIINSLLGNYRHAKIRPTNLLDRLDIYDNFSHRKVNRELLFIWIMKYLSLVMYCLKEFLVFSIVNNLALDIFLLADPTTTNWEHIKKNILFAMDKSREILSESTCVHEEQQQQQQQQQQSVDQAQSMKEKFKKTFERIEGMIKIMHQLSLRHLIKIYRINFIKKMLTELKKFCEHKSRQADERMSAFIDDEDRYVNPDKLLAMKQIAKLVALRQDNKLETRWLKYLGMTPYAVQTLRLIFLFHHEKLISDRVIQRKFGSIYEICIDDFYLFYHYVKILAQMQGMKAYPLSKCIVRNQIEALKKRHGYLNWHPFTETLDRFEYCSECKTWISACVKGPGRKMRAIYSLGSQKTLYDPISGYKFCKRANTIDNNNHSTETIITTSMTPSHKSDEEEEEEETDYSPSLSITTTIKKKSLYQLEKTKQKTRCKQTAISNIGLVGKIQSLGGQLWFLCEVCAIISPFSELSFSGNGITCRAHRFTLPLKGVNSPILDMIYWKIGAHQIGQLIQRIDWNFTKSMRISYRKTFFFEDNNAIQKIYCNICGNVFSRDKLQFIDCLENGIIKQKAICEADSKLANAFLERTTMPDFMRLKKYIEKKWYMKNLKTQKLGGSSNGKTSTSTTLSRSSELKQQQEGLYATDVENKYDWIYETDNASEEFIF